MARLALAAVVTGATVGAVLYVALGAVLRYVDDARVGSHA